MGARLYIIDTELLLMKDLPDTNFSIGLGLVERLSCFPGGELTSLSNKIE